MATNYGGMFPLNPDMQLEAQDISRRRALADMLTANSLKPIDPMQNSGKYITPISPVQGLAQLGQALLAAHSNDVVRGEEQALGERSRQQMDELLNGKTQPVQPQLQAPPAGDPNIAQFQPSGAMSQPDSRQQQGGLLSMPGINADLARALRVQFALNPSEGVKSIVDAVKPTEAIRTLQLQGIDPKQMGSYLLGKAQNDATFTVAPGTLFVRPGEAPAISPDMKNGLQGTLGPDGRFSVGAMPGYSAANAQIQGDQTRAVEEAKDAFAPLFKMLMPDGREMYVTQAQARAIASGQPPMPQRPQPAPMQPPAQVSRPIPAAPRMPGNVGMPPASTPNAGVASSSAILKYEPIVPDASPPSAPQQVAGGGLVAGQTDQQKARDKNVAIQDEQFITKLLPDLVKKSETARDGNAQVTALREIIANEGFTSGTGTALKAAVGGFLTSSGLGTSNVAKFTSDVQRFNLITTDVALNKQLLQTGAQTESDSQRTRETIANLGNTPAANAFALDWMEAVNNARIKQAAFYEDGVAVMNATGDTNYGKIVSKWRSINDGNGYSIWQDPVLKKYITPKKVK
jgi:hypothetical protein